MSYWNHPNSLFDEDALKVIVGKVPTEIRQDNERIFMRFEDGSECHIYHDQDCCESVYVEDVVGDFQDLVGHPLLVAEERNSEGTPPLYENEESYTWTFYTFRNIGGSVDVRWYGSSNGYYSESVTVRYDPV